MASQLAQDLAQAERGMVIAPAGCGKTHLISEAVGCAKGRQLVLTHTHAGVKAIRERMLRLGVAPELYRVATIDAFALKYASAFPGLSAWTVREPEGAQWAALRPAALLACRAPPVIDVLRASYAGIYVDEYQDCTVGQHALVMHLASLLPCRILGDPLQAIFRKINKGEALAWQTAREQFAELGTLTQPQRWLGRNDELGHWLLHVRDLLLAGQPVDLAGAPGVELRLGDPSEAYQIATCFDLAKRAGSVVALRAWRAQCHRLSGRLNNAFYAVEDAQCEDLVDWGRRIQGVTGVQRVDQLVEFAGAWLTRLPSALVEGVHKSVQGQKACRAKRPDAVALHEALSRVRDDPTMTGVVAALNAFATLEEKPVFVSREIWMGLRAAAQESGTNADVSLSAAIAASRERARRFGRGLGRQCLATPLLVKGLEFDHVAILNSGDLKDAELVYVGLTRACRGMIVISPTAKLTVAKPSW
jgi:DNA helicase-2/ATP-dependent DNA helicase PcrA